MVIPLPQPSVYKNLRCESLYLAFLIPVNPSEQDCLHKTNVIIVTQVAIGPNVHGSKIGIGPWLCKDLNCLFSEEYIREME